MPQPSIIRGPTAQGSIGANNELRFPIGLGSPIRALHYFATDGGVALTEAQGEADIAKFHVEMAGINIWESTPTRMNDISRFYRQATGGNVTNDGRYTISPHRRHLRPETVLGSNGQLGQHGAVSPEWGTGGLSSLVLVITCAAAVTNWDGGVLYIEYDAAPERQGEPPGQIYRLRQQNQSGLGTGWNLIGALWRQGLRFQKLLAFHFILDSGVVDVNEGFSFKINKQPRIHAITAILDRLQADESRTPISGYKHVDFQSDNFLSSCPDLGSAAGVVDVLAEVNLSTAPTGNDTTVLIEDVVDWAEIRGA